MSKGNIGWSGAISRILGASLFVVLTLPFGPVPAPQGLDGIPIPLAIIGVILIVSAHSYLALRAYYALHRKGLILSAVISACLISLVVTNIGIGMNYIDMLYAWIVVYLSLIYSFGLIYNFIDGMLSGLVHAKDVH